MKGRRWIWPLAGFGLVTMAFMVLLVGDALAVEVNLPGLSLQGGGNPGDADPEQVSIALQILAFMTLFSLAPGILVMVTSFTRVIVVMSFVRQAMGLQGQPPNQVLIALALFVTMFVMGPVMDKVWDTALNPYLNKQIGGEQAWDNAVIPVKDFMLRQTRESDLGLFMRLAGMEQVEKRDEAPLRLVIPAFMVSELKTAFQIGFMVYLPFLIVDMVVASVVMSMGMMMLPPLVISMPIKLILFVLVDGWVLVVGSLVQSFR
ncbi:flagellar biosynthetic protein FliP [Magnetococcus marinus MC-1]|uniref:Flagellar biosynthetic protein FliP n=1 Tax=Magnetococcus marinus (strain ATCC BAA-1437 / JCM 17883 / MC-1) TaxID=156889 RepID=A0LDK7_MAGMM|nr:flagellar type III secretion system pore protein FliP [Magnetococcus marinus]ABK46050.1 flagellar biosynthetic protein FliP [Magnetococcus marinus MC-1]